MNKAMDATASHSETPTVALIREALTPLAPTVLRIDDQSEGHLHHAGRGKGGHFKVTIVSDLFTGKTALQRHQMIYQALGELMTTHIHALSMAAKAPGEY